MEYNDKEYIKLYRKLLENTTIMIDADHLALWTYILLIVAWKECYANFNGEKIKLKAGQFVIGRKSIANKLNISESKTQRILKKFESEHMIEQQMSSKSRLITVLNWSSYQSCEQQIEQQMNNKRTTDEQQMNTEEEYKKLISKEIKNNSKDIVGKTFVKPTVDEVNDYCLERSNGIKADEFVDFYESKGWYVGKNKMKDWRAAIRTWENKNKSKPLYKREVIIEPIPEYVSKNSKMSEEEVNNLKERLKKMSMNNK